MPTPQVDVSAENAAAEAATRANEQPVEAVDPQARLSSVGGQAAEMLSALVPGAGAAMMLAQLGTRAAAGAAQGAAEKAAEKEKARKQGKLEGLTFEEMWAAHPHNYQESYAGGDASQNTSSADVNEAQGWDPDQWANTCAIRISVMLNTIGGAYAITPEKAAAAGIKKSRVFYSKKTKWYYLLAAKEIWQYATARFGTPHKVFPANGGRYQDEAAFNTALPDITAELAGKKGLAGFDKIFGYSGTGHVDIFDGEQLSNAPGWYACQRLMLWYI